MVLESVSTPPPDSRVNKATFQELNLRLASDAYRSRSQSEQDKANRYYWMGISVATFEQFGLAGSIKDLATWVQNGLVDNITIDEPRTWEAARRDTYHILFRANIPEVKLSDTQLDDIKSFLTSLAHHIPRLPLLLSKFKINTLPSSLSFGQRVALTMALLARDALRIRGVSMNLLPNLSLPAGTIELLVQHGWKFAMSSSSRSISRFLTDRIRVGNEPSKVDTVRRNNIERAIAYVKQHGINSCMNTDGLQQINSMVTKELVPDGLEGRLRDYEGGQATSSRDFPVSDRIATLLEDFLGKIRSEIESIKPLPEDDVKQQRALRLIAYIMAKTNDIKPLQEANNRTAYVLAAGVLHDLKRSYHFSFPDIFQEGREGDMEAYIDILSGIIDTDGEAINLDHDSRLQPLISFISSHLKPL